MKIKPKPKRRKPKINGAGQEVKRIKKWGGLSQLNKHGKVPHSERRLESEAVEL